MRRRYDAVVEEVEHSVFTRGAELFHPRTRSAGFEVKVQSSSLGRQARVDDAVTRDGSFVQQVVHLRYPASAIPEKEFERAAREMLSKHAAGKAARLTAREIDMVVGELKRLRRRGDWVTAELIVGAGARMAANLIAGKELKLGGGPWAPAEAMPEFVGGA